MTVSAATISIYSTRDLSDATLSEIGISSSATARNEGTYDADVTWEGVVDGENTDLDQIYTGTAIVRTDLLFWYYEFNSLYEKQPTFNVSYRLFGTGGTENTLTSQRSSSSNIRATITPQPVTCSKYKNFFTYRCYGYATMDIDLADASRSGSYRGTVQVTIVYY